LFIVVIIIIIIIIPALDFYTSGGILTFLIFSHTH